MRCNEENDVWELIVDVGDRFSAISASNHRTRFYMSEKQLVT